MTLSALTAQALTSIHQYYSATASLLLVKLVETGLFIEMAELHPSYLHSVELNTGNQPTAVSRDLQHCGLGPVLRYIHDYSL